MRDPGKGNPMGRVAWHPWGCPAHSVEHHRDARLQTDPVTGGRDFVRGDLGPSRGVEVLRGRSPGCTGAAAAHARPASTGRARKPAAGGTGSARECCTIGGRPGGGSRRRDAHTVGTGRAVRSGGAGAVRFRCRHDNRGRGEYIVAGNADRMGRRAAEASAPTRPGFPRAPQRDGPGDRGRGAHLRCALRSGRARGNNHGVPVILRSTPAWKRPFATIFFHAWTAGRTRSEP